jgi:hypothetical protein
MSIGMAVAAVLSLTLGARAEEQVKRMKPMKGGEHLLMFREVKTKQEVDTLKTGDSIAMVCAKCKTVWTTRVKQGTKGAQILAEGGQVKELIGNHACAGCKSEVAVVGVQKGAHTELKHTCKACGDGSAFCCATKSGSGATKGMSERETR